MLSINNNTAFNFARILARLEGIPAGISSGAAVAAAVEINEDIEMKNKNTVIIILHLQRGTSQHHCFQI